MRLPPTQIQSLIDDLGREPTPIELRIIREAVHLGVLIDKDQASLDKMQPLLKTTGCNGQEKVSLNPLVDRISKNIERKARILHYLDRPAGSDKDEVLTLLDDLMKK